MERIILKLLLLSLLLFSQYCLANQKINISGNYNFSLGLSKQSNDFKNLKKINGSDYVISNNNKDIKFLNYGKLSAQYLATIDNGLKYGVNINLYHNLARNNEFDKKNSNKSYLFFNSNLGRLELGSNWAASRLVKIDGFYFTSINSTSWLEFVNFPELDKNLYITTNETMLNRASLLEEARKITYITPQIYDMQLAISYIPDPTNKGNGTLADEDTPDGDHTFLSPMKNIISIGIKYNKKIYDYILTLSLSGDKARMRQDIGGQYDIKSYQMGASINYNNFNLAASYGSDGKSSTAIGTSDWHSKFYSIGANYQYNNFGYNLVYFGSIKGGKYMLDSGLFDIGKYKIRSVIFKLTYDLAEGLRPYIETSFFNVKTSNQIRSNGNPLSKNSGKVFIAGMQLYF